MFYLIFSILSSTSIAVIFKIAKIINVKIFPIIVINYFSATLLSYGMIELDIEFISVLSSSWIYLAGIIGILLIAGFYLIGYTTQKAGIAITTVSNKMSVVIPMLFSILYYNEKLDFIKTIGVIIALVAVVLSVYKKNKVEIDKKYVYLPILLFLVIGIIDSFIKLAQADYLSEDQVPVFSAIAFGTAAVIGVFISLVNKIKINNFFNLKTIITGVLLGAFNYGSMYFLIKSLNHCRLESYIVYGVNNIGIISLSVILAFSIFREKLLPINWAGIGLSVISIIFLTLFK